MPRCLRAWCWGQALLDVAVGIGVGPRAAPAGAARHQVFDPLDMLAIGAAPFAFSGIELDWTGLFRESIPGLGACEALRTVLTLEFGS